MVHRTRLGLNLARALGEIIFPTEMWLTCVTMK
jgi:hypothetical protein